MNKKSLAWIYIVILSIGTILSLYIPKQETAAKEVIVIPNEAIRLRILANSDLAEDQALKRKVRDAVNKEITKWVESLDSLDDAQRVVKSHLPEIEEIAKRVIREEKSKQTVKVEFGPVQFPTKLYGQFLYPAGEYEAVLITLGKGEGANWWCVLYPPLCFMDFSNGATVSPGFEGKKPDNSDTSNSEKEETVNKSDKAKKPDNSATSNSQKEMTINHSDKVKIETNSNQVQAKQQKAVEVKETEQPESSPKETKKEEKKSNGQLYAEEKDDDVKVKFFVVELFRKIF